MEEKKFAAKRDSWLAWIIWIPLLVGLGFAFTSGNLTIMLIIGVAVAYAAWIWFATYYVLEEDYLLINTGPIKEKIKYGELKSIKRSGKPGSAAALSASRLEVRYGEKGQTLISPEKSAEFIKLLQEKCPDLIVEE